MTNNKTINTTDVDDKNRDPVTNAAGYHPVGTGVGAASGAVAGAAAGAAAGPIGMAAGAAIGAVAGGLVGKAAGEALNPTEENEYWKGQYKTQDYYRAGLGYEHYSPAYQTGYTARGEFADRQFEDVEGELERRYAAGRGDSSLGWNEARPAVKAAWSRADRYYSK